MTTVVRKLAFFRSGEEHVAGGVAGGVTGGVGGSLQGSIFVCGVHRAAIAPLNRTKLANIFGAAHTEREK